MHGNRDSIMKPEAAAWRYRRLASGAGRRETLWCYLSGRRCTLHVLFIKQRFMLAS
jgi:hypothetical protein